MAILHAKLVAIRYYFNNSPVGGMMGHISAPSIQKTMKKNLASNDETKEQ